MEAIFDMLNEATRPMKMSPEMAAAHAEHTHYIDLVHKAFSLDFVNAMTMAEWNYWSLETREHFVRGVRLGAQLLHTLLMHV